MGLLDDLKSFISNGNVLDLSVGVITGAAFSKVVSSFTDDIIMPSVALLKSTIQHHVPGAAAVAAAAQPAPTAAADSGATHVAVAAADTAAHAAHVAVAAADTATAAAHVAVAAAAPAEGLASIGIGNFISALVYFAIISLVILMVTKVANRFRKPAEVEVVNEANLEPVLSREEALLIEIRDALLRGREPQA